MVLPTAACHAAAFQRAGHGDFSRPPAERFFALVVIGALRRTILHATNRPWPGRRFRLICVPAIVHLFSGCGRLPDPLS